MKGQFSKFIDERINYYYSESGYVELDFQKQAIKDAVRFNLYSLVARSGYERRDMGIFGNFDNSRVVVTGDLPYIDDTREDLNLPGFVNSILGEDFSDFTFDPTTENPEGNSYTKYSKANFGIQLDKLIYLDVGYYPVPVIHLDVGMGKTVCGMIAAFVTIEAYLELNKVIEDLAKKCTVIPYTNQHNKFLNYTLKDFQINVAIIPAMKREFEKMTYKLFMKEGMTGKISDYVTLKYLPNNLPSLFTKDNLDPHNNFSLFYHEMFDKIGLCAIDTFYKKTLELGGEDEALMFLENTTIQGISMDAEEVAMLENQYEFEDIDIEYLKSNFWKRTQELTVEYAGRYGLPFVVIDEFASPKTFVYRNEAKFRDIFDSTSEKGKYLACVGVGLTASSNKAIDPVNWMTSRIGHYYSSFLSKQDVIEELVSKGIYKEAGFLYQNLYMNANNVQEYQDKLDELSSMNFFLQDLLKKRQKDIFGIQKTLNQNIDEFLAKENEMMQKGEFDGGENLQNFSLNIAQIKQPVELMVLDTTIDDFVKKKQEFEKQIEEFKIKSFYAYKIEDILEDKGLGDLQEQKVIYLFDSKYKREFASKLKDFVSYLKENDIDTLAVNEYSRDKLDAIIERKIKEAQKENPEIKPEEVNIGGIALVGCIEDLGKGFNLQDFDTIVIMYANQCSFDDIYQALGRLDRIGTDTSKMKEAIFVHFLKNEAFFDELLKKRTNLALEVKIEDYLITKDLPKQFMSSITKDVEVALEDVERIVKQNKLWEIAKTAKKHLAEIKEKTNYTTEQIELYESNRDLVLEMVKNIQKLLQSQLNCVYGMLQMGNGSLEKTKILEALDTIQSIIEL